MMQQRTLKTILFQRCQQTTLTYDRAGNLAMLVQKINDLEGVSISRVCQISFIELAASCLTDVCFIFFPNFSDKETNAPNGRVSKTRHVNRKSLASDELQRATVSRNRRASTRRSGSSL